MIRWWCGKAGNQVNPTLTLILSLRERKLPSPLTGGVGGGTGWGWVSKGISREREQ